MRWLMILVTLMFMCVAAFSQDSEIYTVTEVPAEFPGGTTALMSFLSKNIHYPERARDLGVGGKVFLKFVVNENGDICDVEVIKSGGYVLLDLEAQRVLKTMPQWSPAKMKGKAVKTYFNLPVNFAMDEPFYFNNVANENAVYKELMQMILDGNEKQAFAKYQTLDDKMTDPDLLYMGGVMYLRHKKKNEGCSCLAKVIEVADPGSTVSKNAYKFLQKNCN